MSKTRKENPVSIGISENDVLQRYGTSGKPQSSLVVINENLSHVKKRTFDLNLQKEYSSARKKESKGWILKNEFSSRFKLHEYGILFEMLFSGAIRYKKDQDAGIFQTCEHTIECVTAKDGVLFDLFFFWDGMCGTNSQKGWANFDINISVQYEDTSRSLAQKDGISSLGAKTCKGSLKLIDNFVKKQGTPVTFVVQYEMSLGANSDPLALSEVHFDQPGSTYFKIVTK